MDPTIPRLWRARELCGAVGIGVWALFHLWEQWSAFAGRGAFVTRAAATSHGALAVATELVLGLGPVLGWIALDGLTARRAEPAPLRGALADHPALAERLARAGRWGSRILAVFVLYHAGWLWLPKLLEGSEPLQSWQRLRDGLGTWPHAIAHAAGVVALAIHVWQAPPRLAIALGLVERPELLRALRVSGLIVAIGLAALYGQLAGWHASGAGTFWPLGPETLE